MRDIKNKSRIYYTCRSSYLSSKKNFICFFLARSSSSSFPRGNNFFILAELPLLLTSLIHSLTRFEVFLKLGGSKESRDLWTDSRLENSLSLSLYAHRHFVPTHGFEMQRKKKSDKLYEFRGLKSLEEVDRAAENDVSCLVMRG